MLESIIHSVGHHVVAFISHLGYPAIIICMLIESACIPLPSEIIMPFSGYLVSVGRFTLWGATAAGVLGNLLGSVLIYLLSINKGYALIHKMSPHHAEKAERFYERYGSWSVLIGRMLPVVRTFISLPAGVMRVPFLPFCFWTIVGSIPWCFGLTYLGFILGKNWTILQPIFHHIDIPLVCLLIAGIGLWYWKNKD